MDSLKFKRTKTAGKKPTDLTEGEIALNLTDRTVLCQNGSDTVEMLGSIEQRYGMPKAVFEANRNANRQRYAGSGFVEFGENVKNSGNYPIVNQGMFTTINANSSVVKRLCLGEIIAPATDPAPYVKLHIDGIIQTVYASTPNNYINYHCASIPFPSAPSGYETFDGTTYRNYLTDKSDLYLDADGNPTDAGGDINEAVRRAFDGVFIDSAMRDGDVSEWRGSSDLTKTVTDGWLAVTSESTTQNLNLYRSFTVSANTKYRFEFVVDCSEGDHACYVSTSLSTAGSLGTSGWHTTQDKIKHLVIDFNSGNNTTLYFLVYNIKNGTVKYKDFGCRLFGEKIICSRQDFVGIETWLEAVSKYDLVQPFGNSQFADSTFAGKTLTDITTIAYDTKEVAQEDGTTTEEDVTLTTAYSKHGAWQSDNELPTHYGLQWSTLSDSEKMAYLRDPRHNLFWDDENNQLVQAKYRFRVVAGFGNDTSWRSKRRVDVMLDGLLSNNENYAVGIQGQKDESVDWISTLDSQDGSYWQQCRAKSGYASKDQMPLGAYTIRFGSSSVTQNTTDCFMTPVALVTRLNKGAHHPLNFFGCSPIYSATDTTATKLWYSSDAMTLHSLRDCFDLSTETTNTDFAHKVYDGATFDGTTGRFGSDPYQWHDDINVGLVRDLRFNANRVETDTLYRDSVENMVDGKMRGWSTIPVTWTGKLTITESPTFDSGYTKFIHSTTRSYVPKMGVTSYYSELTDQHEKSMFYAYVKSPVSNKWYRMSHLTTNSDLSTGQAGTNYIAQEYGNVKSEFTVTETTDLDVIVTTYDHPDLDAKFDILPMSDLSGTHSDIALAMEQLRADVFPSAWIPNDDYANEVTEHAATKKIFTTKARYTFVFPSSNSSWGGGAEVTVDSNTNKVTYSNKTGQCTMIFYSARADFTRYSAYMGFLSTPDAVFATCYSSETYGNRLINSTIGKVGTATNSYVLGYAKLESYLTYNRIFHNSDNLSPHHLPFPRSGGSGNSNDAPAVKVLPTLVSYNGTYYLQINGCEMHHTVTNVTKKLSTDSVTFELGELYQITDITPNVIVKCVNDNSGTAFLFKDMRQMDNGEWVGKETNTVYFLTAKSNELSGDWGDDQYVPIISNLGTKTDLNGNVLLSFTQHSILPINVFKD